MSCGSVGNEKAIDDAVRDMTLALKADIEEKAGGHFDTFVPLKYASQVVAGTNFFVKVDTGSSCLHVRPLPHTGAAPNVVSVQTGKTADDGLDYF